MDCPTVILFLFGGFIFGPFLSEAAQKMSDATPLFDASDVTWAHAVNSRAALKKELAGSVDFLETDVSVGYVSGSNVGIPIPIMAHPPNTTSDISLVDWIDTVIAANTGKGVKLDFKSLNVVEPSLLILQARTDELNFTLWLNADILYGPVNSTSAPVKDDSFLMLCNQYFPNAVLSVGWTTTWFPTLPSSWNYEWKHVRKMADIIRCFGYENKYPTFTFPVRGIFASRSVKKLQWLLATIPGSTLTVWSSSRDPLLLQDLVRIRKSFPRDRVFYDVPGRLHQSFLKVKNTEFYQADQQITLKDDQWMTLTHGSDHSCSSYTYVSNNTTVFGRSLTTAVLLKKLLFVDESHTFRAKGMIHFFAGYDELAEGTREFSIVVTDVSRFSKNFTSENEDLDLAGSDTDVLWKALNESHLHTFVQDFTKMSSGCRVFKLDTSADRSFQAWTVPCEEMGDQKSIEDAIVYGVPEVSSRKIMVLPKGPFMIGFVSSGDGHVVVHNFEVNGKKENISNTTSVSSISFTSAAVIGMSVVAGYILKKYLY